MRYATFNVLADPYTSYGDYSHVDPELLKPGVRAERIVQQVNDFDASIVALQEADEALVERLGVSDKWQLFWLQKGRGEPDGCLTLVDKALDISEYKPRRYSDESGHVFQIITVGGIAVANTHIKWAPAVAVEHIGASQTRELLQALKGERPSVILADCNDLPDGPVQALFGEAGFTNLVGNRPTASIDKKIVSIDVLAVRGISGKLIESDIDVVRIPNKACPSDHIPVIADLDTGI